jgi:hypothetical protein
MMSETLKKEIISFMENGHQYVGKTLQFKSALSSYKDNFDRHFSSFSKTVFVLENFSCRISGARMMFEGDTQYFEIGADLLTDFQKTEDGFIFMEKYSDMVYRRTEMRVLD